MNKLTVLIAVFVFALLSPVWAADSPSGAGENNLLAQMDANRQQIFGSLEQKVSISFDQRLELSLERISQTLKTSPNSRCALAALSQSKQCPIPKGVLKGRSWQGSLDERS